MASEAQTYTDLTELAKSIRTGGKKFTLLFAYNGKGKTQLCMKFKEVGKQEEGRDTLYFNAFTEDLFTWHNDLPGDAERYLEINTDSKFFDGLEDLDIENRIRPWLARYATFNFRIDFAEAKVIFIREELVEGVSRNVENIKISRGEEMIFYWCFFLAIAELAIERHESYEWVKYIYVDDPISSLDDNKAIAVAHHLARLLKTKDSIVKAVISTHHALFFNVLCNEFGDKVPRLFLHRTSDGFVVTQTNDTPFFYHVSMIQEVKKAADSNTLLNYHFSLLRNILEKAANFHGFKDFKEYLYLDNPDGPLQARIVNILNHGAYQPFEPTVMRDENMDDFKEVLKKFLQDFRFNPALFPAPEATTAA